ncbi:Zinc finger BED domain containing protein 1 [Dissostichus eleginoides]|uniref:Zinc finger BED domain containing protein 1 n=1 Tax=Dissostichus eleginoides TaxID=100907 RepID=A0AAD9EV66_DISEL|nr:Zinc finger BED domain containing protein 1 [Dissostichus eleginoides]
MTTSREELVPKKGMVSSVIWNWFAFARSDLDQTTPRCKVCLKSVASKGSSTTNLLQHLKQKHPAEWEKCCAQRNEKDRGTTSTSRTAAKIQSTVTQTFSNCIPYDKNSARWKAITDAVDLWSSQTMQPYMSLTVHFINNDWTLRSVCLQTAYFPEDHTENGVKDPRIDRAIGVCKKAVSAFSYSWKKRRDMSEVQAELGLPTHQLITESPTRWGSRQRMIERFLEQEKALVRVLGSDKKSRHLVPTWQDLDVLESINKAVKPLQEFTDALSGESYVSVSYIKPVLHLFKTSLLQPEEEDAELTKTIKGKIMRYLDDKYSDPVKDELLDMSSLVDPRFRTTYIDPDKVEPVKKRAVAEMMSLPAPANNSTPQQPGTAVQVRQEDAQPPPKKKMTLAAFFKKNPVSSPNQSEAEKIETELKSFLLTPEVDPDTNPLEWWKRHQPNFPRLSVLAKKYLSIPATSAPSERVFSVGGGIVTCHRACLKPEVVDRLVFLAKNV